jgi:hypothetical protein
MSVSRRSVLKYGLLASASAFAGTRSAFAAPEPALLVFDSRLAQSRALLGSRGARAIDVARQPAALWRDLRAARPTGRVVGLTSWSDLVQARGVLEGQGKRLRVEARRGRLFYWEMT